MDNKKLNNENIFEANEIKANNKLTIVYFAQLICVLFFVIINLLGYGIIDLHVLKIASIVILAMDCPLLFFIYKSKGENRNIKKFSAINIIFFCGYAYVVLGINVIGLFSFPLLLSIIYFDPKYTKFNGVLSIIVWTISFVLNIFFGKLNLNTMVLSEGTVLTIKDNLINTIKDIGYDNLSYLRSSIKGCYVQVLTFLILSFLVSYIVAKKGREMIEDAALKEKEKTRLETELSLAFDIQSSMLPKVFPAFPDDDKLDLYATNIPAKEVGGDFYNYFKIDDDNVALVMADVSGKGVGAALFMSKATTIIKDALLHSKSTAISMETANRQLAENNEAELFVTTWLGIYNIRTKELTYTNAGHNPPLIYTDNNWSYLKKKHGLVLAALGGVKYKEDKVTLNEGDALLLYTDGVTEATNVDKELYGEERLLNIVNANTKETSKDLVKKIIDELNSFQSEEGQFDDITLMSFKINA